MQRYEAPGRIVFAYGMHLDDRRISVSLTTVLLAPDGAGTRLTFTEQGAFLDGPRRLRDARGRLGALLDGLRAIA